MMLLVTATMFAIRYPSVTHVVMLWNYSITTVRYRHATVLTHDLPPIAQGRPMKLISQNVILDG
jgi:hypothetical protein